MKARILGALGCLACTVGCFNFTQDAQNYCEAPCDAGVDFTVSVIPQTVSVAQDGGASVVVTVTPTGPLKQGVLVSLITPTGSGVTASPIVLDAGVALADGGAALQTGLLSIAADATAPVGGENATIQATSGGLTHTVPLGITVTPAGSADFSIALNPQLIDVVQGASTPVDVTVTATGPLPQGVFVTLVTPNGSGVSAAGLILDGGSPLKGQLLVAAAASAPLASVNATVQGVSGSLAHMTALGVTVTQPNSLTVNITGVPGGATTSVTVTGPSFSQSISTTQTFLNLQPGVYTVSAPSFEFPTGQVIGSIYAPTVTGAPATLTANGTASITVAYGAQGGSGHLWVIDQALDSLSGYSAAQLTTGGLIIPDVALGFATCSHTYGMAFDASGNLWVSCDVLDQVMKYAPSQLLSSGSAQPVAFIPSAGGVFNSCGSTGPSGVPASLAFDHAGNLWVTQYFANAVARFDATKLVGDGGLNIQSSTVISSTTPGDFVQPHSLTFDSAGNLWLVAAYSCTFGVGPGIMKIKAADLAATGTRTVTPVRYYSPALGEPVALGIDSSGDFWITDLSTGAIAKFTSGQIASATPDGGYLNIGSPTFQFTSSNHNPNVSSFDEKGDLWTVNISRRSLTGFYAQNLVGLGSMNLTPDVQIDGTDAGASGLHYLEQAFSPSHIIP